VRRGAWRFLALGLWLGACGGAVGKPTVGGESHFLRKCGDDKATCGSGLTCVSGVCTRGCLLETDKCTDLSPRATCTNASIEPGELAVCDVSCAEATACAALGEDFVCDHGFCRGPSVLPPAESSGGAGGGSLSGGSGSVSGAAGSSGTATGAGGTASTPRRDLYTPPACSGDAALLQLCTGALECVAVPDSETNPTGFCVEQSGVSCTVGGDTAQCSNGFVCTEAIEDGLGRCAPTRVDCVAPYACESKQAPEACPYGYGRSRVNVVDGVAECWGPCVPIQTCGCDDDQNCPSGAACSGGTCAALLPWKPPAYCHQPFDRGICDDVVNAFAMVDGECQAVVYGGCGGNDNRFRTLEECLATCEGRPSVNACPEGRVSATMEPACGVRRKQMTGCAQPCEKTEDCADPLFGCFNGICQAGGCL